MNVIVIYHHPQECGSAYVAFIDQSTGQMVEAVDIPDGYWDSGLKRIDVYTPVYSFTEEVNMSPMPTVDNVTLAAKFKPNPMKYVFRVTKVDNIQKDDTLLYHGDIKHSFITWKATVHAEACTHDIKWQYSTKRDSFRKQLSKAGFDMGHWTLTKRMKTPFKEFLTSICSNYKDYHLVNLLEIG
jgi:hypothetical protein